ncbi:hypothetical protein [Mycobacterium riyadhense]|uniref:hypothetical protein n=1 Tax=Mycobacterium riyadhense TaxID=486698 RepID=UPI00195D8169|nr:hypothetical protein [Mycobacterium riyadhense]
MRINHRHHTVLAVAAAIAADAAGAAAWAVAGTVTGVLAIANTICRGPAKNLTR